MARPADKYVELGRTALLQLLEDRHAVVWQEAVGRISYRTDTKYPDVQYYPLSLARSQLAEEGLITEHPRSKPQVVVLQRASRPDGFSSRDWERLPGARAKEYLPHRRWGMDKPTTGSHAEHVLVNSLTNFARGRLIVRQSGIGNVTEVNGASIGHNQSLDALAFAAPATIGTTQPDLVPLVFECKNIYEWIYPWSYELWELLVKAARVAVQGVPLVPVLASVRTGYTLTRMSQDVGFLQTWFQRQLVDPERVDASELTFIQEELRLAVSAHPRDRPHDGVRVFIDTAMKEIRHPLLNRSVPVAFVRSDRFAQAAPVILRHASGPDGAIRSLEGDHLSAFAADLRREVGGPLTAGWF